MRAAAPDFPPVLQIRLSTLRSVIERQGYCPFLLITALYPSFGCLTLEFFLRVSLHIRGNGVVKQTSVRCIQKYGHHSVVCADST